MRCCDVERLWDEMRDALQPHREEVVKHSAGVPAVPGALRAVRRHRVLPDLLAAARAAGDARAEDHRAHSHRRCKATRSRQRREGALAARPALRRVPRKRHHLRRARPRRRRRSARSSASRRRLGRSVVPLNRARLGERHAHRVLPQPHRPISPASTSATSRRSNKRRCARRPRSRPAKSAATAGSPRRSASPTRRAPSAA